ncbi:serine/threonine-protein kinase [Actinomadura rubrisoli]|uniref:serine/threonine-protein kinase n=1 Tax=Actinomadura rubrisoli TaxID=2530368 RepID=UPI001A9F4E99|nr:serine/threonine-protein kinase [Actinomadura rubrisoli]
MSDGEHTDQEDGRLLAGRYRLLSVVGSGGMGTVWRAHDETLDREVAVKEVVLHASLGAQERETRHLRTLREARASARLNHPGVVTVHDVVDEDGRPWIVMELVRARSLQGILDEDGPLPPGRVAAIGRQIAGALRAAHAIGILHRDVKPANVLVAGDRAVLTDFGIAQLAGEVTLTHTGLIMGSPAYMSPERVKGDGAIPASDLWALGATLYAACEGKAPHHRSDAMAVLAAAMTQDVPPPRNAGPLAPILLGLLERDPVRRMGADRAEESLAAIASGHAASQAAAELAEQGGGRPDGRSAATVDDRHWSTGTAADQGSTRVAHQPLPSWPASPESVPPSSVPPQSVPPHAIPAQSVPVPDVNSGMLTQHPGYPQGPGGPWTSGMGPSGPSGVPPKRRNMVPVLVGALVAVAIIVPAAVFLWPDGSSGGDPGASQSPIADRPSSGPSTTPSDTPSSAASSPRPSRTPLPAGLVRSAGPGYSIGIPQGWRRSEQGNSTVWTDPVTSAYVQVDRTPWSGDPYEHWMTWKEQARADGRMQGFRDLGVTRTSVGDVPAADIEFVWARQGGTRARDRGVIYNGRAYAVVVAVPVSKWNENEALVKNVLDAFQPAGVG